MYELKYLTKAYAKRFKQLNKTILTANDAGLLIFVEHLKYLRDYYVVIKQSTSIITTLNAAIEEFEAFKQSKNDFHWNNFCEFVKLNMKEWLMINDSV